VKDYKRVRNVAVRLWSILRFFISWWL